MKKNVGFKYNNNPSNKRMSLLSKNKKLNEEMNIQNNNLKENFFKSEDNPKYNHINKSIDNKTARNKEKKNNPNKKIKKLSNKSSLSKLIEINDSEEQHNSVVFNKQNRNIQNNNNNKNNSVILTNVDNIYSIENNINNNLLLEEKSKNNDYKKHKNGSSCNIKVNKPTKLILDKNITINDISTDKSLPVNNNNNYTSETFKAKKQ